MWKIIRKEKNSVEGQKRQWDDLQKKYGHFKRNKNKKRQKKNKTTLNLMCFIFKYL